MSEISLTDEFTASAKKLRTAPHDVILPMLLTQFSTLMRHALTDNADKNAVAAAMFAAATDIVTLDVLRPTSNYIRDDARECLSKIFSKLLTPESVDHIPAHAVQDLTELTLAILRKAEATDRTNFPNGSTTNYEKMEAYKNAAAALAEITLSFADQFKTAIENSAANVTTNNPVVASKPLVLTRGPGGTTA